MGETRVDLLHLLEDLRDAYPGSLEETILTEIMANALDSGATEIGFDCNPENATLTTVDNGAGMRRRELARYHDIAASTKTRGQGIGFAGVGIKLGLLVCDEVLTETRRGKSHVATTWRLASRHRAPWKWVQPKNLVTERGTAVRLKVQNALSPLLDAGFLEGTLRRHFQPLFDPAFDPFLAGYYPRGIAIFINGRKLEKHPLSGAAQALLEIRLFRKRKPSALGYLIRTDYPLAEEQRGLAISTYGKVIKRGWDWVGLSPASPDCVSGLIEVPQLAASLTLNKGDFIRTGPRGAAYLAFRKGIQEAVTNQLAAWGDTRSSREQEPPKEVRPLQRDLARLLEDLAFDFPLLSSLVEHRAGGQKKLPLQDGNTKADGRAFVAATVLQQNEMQEIQPESDNLTSDHKGESQPGADGEQRPSELKNYTTLPVKSGAPRPAHYGLDIRFDDRADDMEIGRLVESTVWVNRSHPAYRRALDSRSLGYHISLAVALALAPLAVEPSQEHTFITAFLSHWGESTRRSMRKRLRP
jgi:hypothetical protein